MKNYSLILVGFLSLTFSSCLKDHYSGTRKYIASEPVYMSLTDVRTFKAEAPKPITVSGKFYTYANMLFVNEPYEGIHIFDNTDTKNPVQLSFLSIPGNIDIAVKDNILYADNCMDLIAVDISNPKAATLVSRVTNAYPNITVDATKGVIVKYVDHIITEKEKGIYESYGWGVSIMEDKRGGAPTVDSGGGNKTSNINGQGGSLARFARINDYLYVIDNTKLYPYSISTATNPTKKQDITVGNNIETIFPYQDSFLFIGSTTAMYIYGLKNPANPNPISITQHFRSCDPVVADGDYAFVTLRAGTRCEGTLNQLRVYNVADKANIFLVAPYTLTNPYGLAVDKNLLFVCDGKAGLKMYDISNINSLVEMASNTAPMTAYDVIAKDNILYITAKEGVYQYDYSDSKNLKLLSFVGVN